MNDKRLINSLKLLSCWYTSTNLQPNSSDDEGLRYMDAKYLAEQLHFKPRMIYKLTQQLLDNKEIIMISKSYNGKAHSKLYSINRDIIENYILLLKMKYHNGFPNFFTLINNYPFFYYPQNNSK